MKEAPFNKALKFWSKLGFISFGGPAGQIAVMHQEVVERRNWIGENQFLRALNFCMLLPGPEAQQLATYIDWRLHGTLGGIFPGCLFVIPSVLVMLLLSYLAVAHIDIPAVAAAFYGITSAVVGVILNLAVWFGHKVILPGGALYFFALVSAIVSLVILQRFHLPIHFLVPVGAVIGVIWQILIQS